MEKLLLKPTVSEITIKGAAKEGHTDVFAYDYYDDEDKRKLGSLFMVGNVKQEDTETQESGSSTLDIAYIINLAASLAKREYYSKPEISARDAFSATLKKVNDVVEEFFTNKGLKLNLGIFAIAGEQILISKLGRFKIILGRPASPAGGESRVVDILNNVDLFSKEQADERSFSNVVSGKIMPGDKLFAFHPNRLVTAREKNIKADLLKFDSKEFLGKLDSIVETKPNFECGAIYISLDKQKRPVVAKKAKPVTPSPVATNEEVRVNLAKAGLPSADVEKSTAKPGGQVQEESVEIPKIISSEFSLGKKSNPLFASIKILRGLYSGPGSYTATLTRSKLTKKLDFKRKTIVLSTIAGLLVVGFVVVKKFVVVDPAKRQINTVVSQVKDNIQLANDKIAQNDFIGARLLLAESISNIYGLGISDEKIQKTTAEIYATLDKVDSAIEASPSLLESIPPEVSQEASLITAQKGRLTAGEYGVISVVAFDVYEENLYVLTPDTILKVADTNQSSKKTASSWLKTGTLPSQASMIAVDGKIYVMGKSGALATYYKGEKISEVNTFLVSSDNDALLTSKDSDKLYLVNKLFTRVYELDKNSGSLVRTIKVGSSEPFIDAYLSGDSAIIITTKDGRIWEIK